MHETGEEKTKNLVLISWLRTSLKTNHGSTSMSILPPAVSLGHLRCLFRTRTELPLEQKQGDFPETIPQRQPVIDLAFILSRQCVKHVCTMYFVLFREQHRQADLFFL